MKPDDESEPVVPIYVLCPIIRSQPLNPYYPYACSPFCSRPRQGHSSGRGQSERDHPVRGSKEALMCNDGNPCFIVLCLCPCPPPLRPPRSLPPTPQSYPEQVHSIDMMLSTGHTPTIDWDCPLLPPLPPACHHHTPWCTVARHVDGPAGWRLVWPVGWTPSLPTSPTTFNHLLSRPRSVYVTGYKTTAKLIKPDAIAGASIVHVIDRVLIPDLSG